MSDGPRERAGSVAVLIVHHASYAALRDCLKSVEALPELHACLVRDQSEDRAPLAKLAEEFSWVRFIGASNLGFAGGANALIAEAEAQEAEFLLLLNPDVCVRADFLEALKHKMRGDPRAALVTGKLLRPDGVTIDSAGIELPAHRRPRDRGSEQPDRGQFETEERVFGASGAALLIRRSALADLAIDGEIFDQDFFLYHEDTDLSWRANLLGWHVWYVPTAVAVHARGWQKAARFEVPVAVRRHSFKNHYLQLIKNERGLDFLKHLPAILGWEILRLGFVLLRDPAMLPAYGHALELVPAMVAKRRRLQRRVSERRLRVANSPAVEPSIPRSH